MKPVIYADTLFLFNFLMNTVVLIIASKIVRAWAGPFKIGVASGLGAVYSVFMFFPELGILYSAVAKLLVLFTVSYMVMGGGGFWKTVKNFLVFLLVNTALGGVLLAFIFLTDFGTTVGSVVSGSGIYINISPFILLFGVAGTYILLWGYQQMSRRRLLEKSLIKRFKVEYKGKTAELDLFLDTGCKLCDPVNDSPVIIAEYDAVKLILSESERKIIRNCENVMEVYENKMRMLPYKTLGGENMIAGIVADRIISGEITRKNVTVGIVTKHSFDGDYKGIFNPEILICEDNIMEVLKIEK